MKNNCANISETGKQCIGKKHNDKMYGKQKEANREERVASNSKYMIRIISLISYIICKKLQMHSYFECAVSTY